MGEMEYCDWRDVYMRSRDPGLVSMDQLDAMAYGLDLNLDDIPGGATPVQWAALDYWTLALYRWWKAERKNAG